MNLVLVSEFGRFVSGIERYLFDLAVELRARGAICGLVYGDRTRMTDEGYLGAFAWSEHLALFELRPDELRAAWLDLIGRRAPDAVVVHKLDRPAALRAVTGPVRTARMIHDPEPFCLSGKKYFFLHTQAECGRPVALGCYPRCLGVRKQRGTGRLPFQFESLAERRRGLAATAELDAVIVASRYMRGQLALNGLPVERIAVVPYFTRPVPTPDPYPADPRRVLFVGRVHREKGVDHFLEAFAGLGPSYEADVFGFGDLQRAERDARERGIAERVRIHGAGRPAEIDRAYRAAAVVVMPSKWPEPFGIVGIEAMAHARPVVAYRTGGIPEWLVDGETGLLVERLDVDALAVAMRRILDDPVGARRMGERGRERVLSGPFNPDAHCRALLAVLGGDCPPRPAEGRAPAPAGWEVNGSRGGTASNARAAPLPPAATP